MIGPNPRDTTADKSRFGGLAIITALALLFCHELDAVSNAEWQILPLLRRLPDSTARAVFVAGHAPLFIAVVWPLTHSEELVRRRSRTVLAALMLAHALAHLLLNPTSPEKFATISSSVYIYGAGLASAFYFLREKRPWARAS